MSDNSENILELVKELQKVSGLPLTLSEDSLQNTNTNITEKRLEDLISLCKNADERNSFFIKFLSGELSSNEIVSSAAKYHVTLSYKNYCLYSIGFKNPYHDVALEILNNLFPPSQNTIVRINKTFIAIIRYDAPEKNSLDENTTADMIVDTLGTEAMCDARVGFDRPCDDFFLLPNSFANSIAALQIAELFSLDDTSICYRTLGLNKLLSHLPEEAVKEYMEDEFNGFSFSELSTESTNTIKTLFDNGLNIAETARALYLHRNTLVYRLEKFHKESGLDLRSFDDAVKCKMGMMLTELLNHSDK